MLRVGVVAFCLFSQLACVNLATLQTARVKSGARVDTQLVVQADPYRKEDTAMTDSSDALSQLGAAVGIRYSEDDQFELGLELTSSFVIRGSMKYQFVDWGPLAMAAGIGVGADVPHALLWLFESLTDEDSSNTERDGGDGFAGELMAPLMMSFHFTEYLALYASGRYHLWLYDDESHTIFAGTGGLCVGQSYGVCAEVCKYESVTSDLDGIFGGASFFFDIHDAYLE